MAAEPKKIKLDEKHDLKLYHEEAVNIARKAGNVSIIKA